MTYVVNDAKLPWPAETLDMSAIALRKGDVEVLLQRELSDEPVAERLERDLVRLRRSTTGFRTLAVEPYDHPFPGGKAVRLRFDTADGPRFEAHLRFRHGETLFDLSVGAHEDLAEACVAAFDTIARTLRVREEEP